MYRDHQFLETFRFFEPLGLDTAEEHYLLDQRNAFDISYLVCRVTITFFNVWLYNCIMNRPFVFINVAMTADGKIDTFARKGSAISSARDKERVDKLRADADAVMVGGRTLLGEDPKLTVKSQALRAERVERGLSPNPVKVGVVTQANIREDSQFLNTGPADIVIFTTRRTSKRHLSLLTARGVDVYIDDDQRVDLQKALATLKDLGIDRLMVEGGGRLNFELLRLGLVDEINICVAPLIFGGESAPTLASGSGLERGEAILLRLIDAEIWEDGGVLLRYQFMR
jgi:2,5-diamino-6-(ribosylamino)-4(3H)-pyrimidinone 5'-phosphate reductase